MAKYQQLQYLESIWTKEYLVKKSNNNWITKHLDKHIHMQSIEELKKIPPKKIDIDNWIRSNLSDEYLRKLSQVIRARRKRYFNSEDFSISSRKTIDLTYEAWKILSEFSKSNKKTLSESIKYLMALNESISKTD